MAKDLGASSPKYHQIVDKKRSYTRFLLTALCCLAFYLIGAWQNSSKVHIDSTTVSYSTGCGALDFQAHHSASATAASKISSSSALDPSTAPVPACDMGFSEHTPCQDAKRSLQFDRARLVYRERHCPPDSEKLQCLIPAPVGYKNPFSWPKSRDYAWFANVPHKELTVEKAIQNWIQYEGDRFFFPGGGTMFPRGADAYIDDINSILPLTDGTIRTALDTGCGVASWGAYLLKRGILTMSFAPRDTHEGQVQFALERGIPAMIGIMASQRLPYPARAFDMAHCSRCLIPWTAYDGLYLIEVDRVLRPGGYWILSGPPVNWKLHWKSWQRTKEDLSGEMTAIENMAKSLCWKKIAEKGNLAIWQKPKDHTDCSNGPEFCDKEQDPDLAWYKPMEACISKLPEADQSEDLPRWPSRLTTTPSRISSGSLSSEDSFNADTQLWSQRASYYKKTVLPVLSSGRYRNIMDMNSGLGGFAAALSMNSKMWVMNVVPHHHQHKTLGVVYERGLIGVYHDWCEAFSTYPRTYDLIHADNVFSLYKDRCEMKDILIEMDRILRPEGAVIVRDQVDTLNRVKRIMTSIRWQSKMYDHESGPFNTEKVLVAVKTYWVGSSNSTL
ncbi:probable methyltransferase PMT16 [Selaginella moellendorffii]|uniref:probable methyltransferase PMT16 n=1 Tax=Selaginella moellendorffii TaxID=88036 RepID=UPI000D1D01D7|nr:probable methyltransferase PMT16 [Selaginella moellendorffii]XP_024542957.1 probable methyltransferase PMT16 [Selaginella moellendorffii]|eukprot:XP_024542956.1 probable methyltransferase PMT16 [Selaginella moellendorffii]